MIQRKQSLWFLISALIAALAYLIPYTVKTTTSIASYEIIDHQITAKYNMISMLLFALIIIFNLIALFLFKNRKQQLTLSFLSILTSIGAFAYEIYFSLKGGNNIVFGIIGKDIYVGLLIPLICIIFTYMAMRGIQNDVKLLKDTDRLR